MRPNKDGDRPAIASKGNAPISDNMDVDTLAALSDVEFVNEIRAIASENNKTEQYVLRTFYNFGKTDALKKKAEHILFKDGFPDEEEEMKQQIQEIVDAKFTKYVEERFKKHDGFHYQGTVTDFEKRTICRLSDSGEVLNHEHFNKAAIFALWKLLVKNIGTPLNKQEAYQKLVEEEEVDTFSFAKLFDNLLAKLKRMTGKSQAEIRREWFDEDTQNVTLKK